ncbi:MAG: pyrimidine dimer DNA glycosylase/endonuclease V [bacterium]
MRMWMINPKYLCNKHLIGEHGEIHKHRHNFIKKHSVLGRLYPIIQIEPMSMLDRHDELVKEMIIRNMNHKSPYIMPDVSYIDKQYLNLKVDRDYSIRDLMTRCEDCRKRIIEYERNN